MAEGIVTLEERHRRTMERAIDAIDAALTAHTRQHGGRFIRFGSTAEGRLRDQTTSRQTAARRPRKVEGGHPRRPVGIRRVYRRD